ncbi:MAG: cell division control protein Cdc6, partial [Halorubrum sp.]
MDIDGSDDPSEDSGSLEDTPPAHSDMASTAEAESSPESRAGSDTDQLATESTDPSQQSIEEMLLEFDEQQGLIRDRSLLDPNFVVEEDRIVGRDEQLQEVTKMLRVALGD